MERTYLSFTLQITGVPGAYQVLAGGPEEIRAGPVPCPWRETGALRAAVDQVRQGYPPDRERMVLVGSALFEALFPRPIFRALERARGRLAAGAGLRLRLQIQPPALSALPWELVYDPDQNLFLAASDDLSVVRVVESLEPVRPLGPVRSPRVLYLASAPPDQPSLRLRESEAAVRRALGSGAQVQTLADASPDALRAALHGAGRGDFDIFHYDGHAVFDQEAQAGALALISAGETHLLTGETLAAYLSGANIRLLVLNGCESGLDAPRRRLTGTAQQAMRSSGLPLAVAMQFAIPDPAAIAFNAGLYAALAQGEPLETAVTDGRQAILASQPGDPFASPEWATPVLFMRGEDGRLFAPASGPPAAVSVPGVQIGSIANISGGTINIAGNNLNTGGNISTGGGSFAGRDQNIQNGLPPAEVDALFAPVLARLSASQANPTDRAAVETAVREIAQEAARGDRAAAPFLSARLHNLRRMAPDIFEVVAALLVSPAAGFGLVVQKVAHKAAQDSAASARPA